MTNREARKLNGRKIVRIEMRSFRDGRGGWATNPVIYLDDGSNLSFRVQEVEEDGYGIILDVEEKRK